MPTKISYLHMKEGQHRTALIQYKQPDQKKQAIILLPGQWLPFEEGTQFSGTDYALGLRMTYLEKIGLERVIEILKSRGIHDFEAAKPFIHPNHVSMAARKYKDLDSTSSRLIPVAGTSQKVALNLNAGTIAEIKPTELLEV
jgi:hypothetical protein